MLRQFIFCLFLTIFVSSTYAQNQIPEHHVDWIFSGQDALKKYLELIREAHSFIHLSNIAFDDDPIARTVAEELCQRAQTGVEVRMLIDSISQAPHTGPYGVVWLTKKMVSKLKSCGIELRFIAVVKARPEETGLKGTKGRHHRKLFIVDSLEDSGKRVLKTMMGSRVFSAIAFEDEKTALPRNPLEKALGVGEGPNIEMSFSIQGPVTFDIQKRFLESWSNYGSAAPENQTKYFPENSVNREKEIEIISHQGNLDQNTQQALLNLINDPLATEIVLVNSYLPSEAIKQAMIQAVKNGKQVHWVSGTAKRELMQRIKEFPDLINAGIQIYLHPMDLQFKTYFNDTQLLTGSMNINQISQQSAEDLFLFKNIELTQELRTKSEELKNESFQLNSMLEEIKMKYPAKQEWKDIQAFLEKDILDKRIHQQYPTREHGLSEILGHTVWFLLSLPTR